MPNNLTVPKVYVASSWKNDFQVAVVTACRSAGMDVYDFKDSEGFSWSEVAPGWHETEDTLTFEQYLEMVNHPRALTGYARDFTAMQQADVFVLVLPAGRSAHLELGWAVGQGKRTAILNMEQPVIPDLMYRMVDYMTDNLFDLLGWMGVRD